MRPTTSSQRSRSRLAALTAEPRQADAVGGHDSALPTDPDSTIGAVAGGVDSAAGPAIPAWLADRQPKGLAGYATLPLAASAGSQEGEAPAAAHDDSQTQETWWSNRVPQRWRGARFAIGGRGLVVLALAGLVAAAIAGVGVVRDQPVSVPVPSLPADPVPVAMGFVEDAPALGVEPEDTGPAGTTGPAGAPEEIIVSVQGLVGTSGLVRLDTGARVADALEAAGGALDGADLHSLNLAQKLGDGDQVLVGVEPTDGGPPRLGSATISAGGHPSGSGGTGTGGPDSGGATSGVGVNLNTATVSDLEALPGVGPVTAQSIVDWRAANGRFTSVDQLSDVRGIGPARLSSLRELVTV